ncbi:hypothetical protein [Skermania sp. ID1734]|uniref:hypothetical protein n=1 Tax=Skermania sp. ID1734 TaxID=2597516 RepID=UPI00163D42D3|nr:hypothetical protein [Skermania sp. ID1734]
MTEDRQKPLRDAQINAARGIIEIDQKLGRQTEAHVIEAAAQKTSYERLEFVRRATA